MCKCSCIYPLFPSILVIMVKMIAIFHLSPQVTNSNATQVLIRNVGFGLSGNFSCEVTADAPLFSTATATGIMQVVGKFMKKL